MLNLSYKYINIVCEDSLLEFITLSTKYLDLDYYQYKSNMFHWSDMEDC